MAEDPRLVRLSRLCAALPEATRERSGRHATFRVGRRVFAYFLDDHHGDGIVGVACKAPEGFAAPLIEADPARFYPPAYLHRRGWIGVRLDRGEVDWDEVADLVSESYVLVAPKRLAATVGAASA